MGPNQFQRDGGAFAHKAMFAKVLVEELCEP